MVAASETSGTQRNIPAYPELNAPFGGVGESGAGSEGGDFSLRFYSQVKTVVMAHDWKPRRPMASG